MTRFILVCEEGVEGSRFQCGAVCLETELALFRHFDETMYCDLLEHVMISEVLEDHFSDGFFLIQ